MWNWYTIVLCVAVYYILGMIYAAIGEAADDRDSNFWHLGQFYGELIGSSDEPIGMLLMLSFWGLVFFLDMIINITIVAFYIIGSVVLFLGALIYFCVVIILAIFAFPYLLSNLCHFYHKKTHQPA